MKWSNQRRTDLLGLAGLAVVIAALNLLWVSLEQRPPHWDMARHLYNSLGYLHLLQTGQWHALLINYAYYPPLMYWLVLPWYLVFGTDLRVAVTANVGCIALLVVSVYALGRYVWGRTAGLLAALVTVTTPMLVSQFKEFQLDAPVTSLATATLYVLVRSEALSRPGWTPALGVMLGLGMLGKWTFFIYLGLPLAYAAGVAVAEAWKERRWWRLSGLVTAGLWAYVIPSFWYITNETLLHRDLVANGVTAGVSEGDPAAGSWASNVWYALNLVNVQLYLGLALVLAAGMVLLLKRRREWWHSRYVLLGAASILIGFTLLRNKDPRYTLPVVPLVVLLGCAGLVALRGRARQVAVAGLVAYSVIMFAVVSFGFPGVHRDVTLPVGSTRLVAWGAHGYIIGAPTSENWHQEEAFRLMARRQGPVMFNGLDTIWFNDWGMQYYGRKYDMPVVPDQANARYLVYRVARGPAVVGAAWSPMRSWRLPDGSELALYQRR